MCAPPADYDTGRHEHPCDLSTGRRCAGRAAILTTEVDTARPRGRALGPRFHGILRSRAAKTRCPATSASVPAEAWDGEEACRHRGHDGCIPRVLVRPRSAPGM